MFLESPRYHLIRETKPVRAFVISANPSTRYFIRFGIWPPALITCPSGHALITDKRQLMRRGPRGPCPLTGPPPSSARTALALETPAPHFFY